MRERQIDTPATSTSQKAARVTAEAAAWWLLIGEADPALVSRFMYGNPEDVKRRAHIAGQVVRLIDAAEISGISDTLTGILTDLFRQQPAKMADF